MQAPREARRIMNVYRKQAAKGGKRKRNGSVGWMDDPGLENLIANSKKRYRRHPRPHNKDSRCGDCGPR